MIFKKMIKEIIITNVKYEYLHLNINIYIKPKTFFDLALRL